MENCIFQRHELKYLVTAQQRDALEAGFADTMVPDVHGESTICNIYYDTPDFRLIRRSLEKPVYKEKLRVRSYAQVGKNDPVFVEIKKKYNDVVFKRRISVPEVQAEEWLSGNIGQPLPSQIADEIDYMKTFYKDLSPKCFLSYEREAFYSLLNDELRITFDENILARTTDMSLTKGAYGTGLLKPGTTLVEVKSPGALPIWLTSFLSENKIRKTSFSKYGEYYASYLRNGNSNKGGLLYA